MLKVHYTLRYKCLTREKFDLCFLILTENVYPMSCHVIRSILMDIYLNNHFNNSDDQKSQLLIKKKNWYPGILKKLIIQMIS